MGKKSSKKLEQIDLNQFEQPLSKDEENSLLETLKARFDQNMSRHKDLDWTEITKRLEMDESKLRSLHGMEKTGGEPDVVGQEDTGEFLFYDCSEESPSGRRAICYDGEGQNLREKKGVFPAGNAIDLATAIGIELLTEDQYRYLQTLGEFDCKTSSWIQTPEEIRKLGGAIFSDRRYDHVFVYHNSAHSFYSARGFRGLLKV